MRLSDIHRIAPVISPPERLTDRFSSDGSGVVVTHYTDNVGKRVYVVDVDRMRYREGDLSKVPVELSDWLPLEP